MGAMLEASYHSTCDQKKKKKILREDCRENVGDNFHGRVTLRLQVNRKDGH